MKISLATTFMIMGLTLMIWVFFDVKSKRLDTAETTVVVGFCAAIILSGKWIWKRLSKTMRESKHEK